MILFRPLLRFLTAAAALAIVAGCDSGSRSQGNVQYDGQPVVRGGIVFIPEGDGAGEVRVKVTGEIRDGRFDFVGRRAPEPGKYRVEITWMKKTGKKVPGEPGHMKDETEQVIPSRYNSESELKVEVLPGNNTFDFDLKK